MVVATPDLPEPTGLLRGDSAILPWFLPGVAISALVGIAAGGFVGRVLGTRRAVGAMLILSLGIILSATLTPLDGRLHANDPLPGACDFLRIGLPPISELLGLNDTSLNVLLFIPLGASIALLPRSRRTVAVLLGAIALPFAIEATQLLGPALGRGCQSADVFDNLAGLAIGLAGGLVARWVAARRRTGAGTGAVR